MPIVQEQQYNIEFLALETNHPKYLLIYDISNYLNTPERPLLFITLPGFDGHIEVEYALNDLTKLDSDSLGLTDECDYDFLSDLPDGVYTVRMAVCPYEELNYTLNILRTTKFEQKLQNLLLTYKDCACLDYKEFKSTFVDIDILIQSAKAEAATGSVKNATDKYKLALKKLDKLLNKTNCN
jgi:hypothetical protein